MVGGPESLCCCSHSLCVSPVVRTGSPVQPVLCSAPSPPAPRGSIHPDWTWTTRSKTHFILTLTLIKYIRKSHEALHVVIYLDMVTSVGLGRALRNSCTAEMSLSISSSELMWCGSSPESQVNPA